MTTPTTTNQIAPGIITLPPPTMPLVTNDNKIERAWYLCLRQVIQQIGGFAAPPLSVSDLQQLTDENLDIATADLPVLQQRVADLEANTADKDLQEYPSLQDVADALLLASCALESNDASGSGTTTVVSSANINGDTHPTSPFAANDEFEYGTAIDTTGARFAGATPWTVNNLGGTYTYNVGTGAVGVAGSGGTGQTMAFQPWASGATTYTCKCWFTGNGSNQAAGLYIYNSANGNGIWLFIYAGGSVTSVEFVVQRQTAFASVSNQVLAGNHPASNVVGTSTAFEAFPIYFQIQYVGGGTPQFFFAYSLTGVAGSFLNFYSETVAVFMGAIPTNIGIVSSPAGGAAFYDWFRRTA